MKYKVTVTQSITYSFYHVEADSPDEAIEARAVLPLEQADEAGDWEFYPIAEFEDDQEGH